MNVLKFLKKLEMQFCWALYPPRCPACDRLISQKQWKTSVLCKDCSKMVTPVGGRICQICGGPLGDTETAWICADCRRRKQNIHYTKGRALYEYSGPMKDAMYRLKYQGRRGLGALFLHRVKEDAQLEQWVVNHHFDGILPVPMHKRKKCIRGYNQAEVLARSLGEYYGIPVYTHMMERVKNTKPMKGLSEEERKNNLKNAFKTTETVVKLNQILVIDDIFTTGDTIDEISRVLLAAGVQRVYFLVMCIGRGDSGPGEG